MLVDKEDQWILDRQNWYIGTSGYVQRPLNFSDGKRRTMLLHRLICGLRRGDKRQVDHINGNKIDNRRANLRICTRRENHYNRQYRKFNKTGYRGVYKSNDNTGLFYTGIRFEGKYIHFGSFKTAKEASEVYLKEVRKLHGEYFNNV